MPASDRWPIDDGRPQQANHVSANAIGFFVDEQNKRNRLTADHGQAAHLPIQRVQFEVHRAGQCQRNSAKSTRPPLSVRRSFIM
jgi:hypothetical protein